METPRFTALDAARLLPDRVAESSKRDYGHALLCAGSPGMAGAAVLAARACLRGGAGLLTVLSDENERCILQTAVPEALFAWQWPERRFDAIGAGPGWGVSDEKAELLDRLLRLGEPLTLDADALNLTARERWLERLPHDTLLTPHEGEFDRLFGRHESRAERIRTAIREAERLHIVILLKGHETFVCADRGRQSVNTTGNAGMATGGSGDTLTGLITALRARRLDGFSAACLGAWLHGRSGDIAAKALGMDSLTASDLTRYLPQAFKELKIPSSSIPSAW